MNRWNPNFVKNGIARLRRWTVASGKGTIAGGEESASPLDISGLAAWWDASYAASLFQERTSPATPAVANNDPVGTWQDRSLGLKHASAPTDDTQRPLLKTNVQNGLPGLLGDGINDVMSFTPITLGRNFTLFFVLKSPQNRQEAYWAYDYNDDMFISFPDMYLLLTGTSGSYVGGVLPTNTTVILTLVRNGTAIEVFQNTTSTGTMTLSANPATTRTQYLFDDAISTGHLCNSYNFERLVYTSTLTAGQLSQIWTYLNTKWAVY